MESDAMCAPSYAKWKRASRKKPLLNWPETTPISGKKTSHGWLEITFHLLVKISRGIGRDSNDGRNSLREMEDFRARVLEDRDR